MKDRSRQLGLPLEGDCLTERPGEGMSMREAYDRINARSSTFVLERLEEFEPVNVYRFHPIKSRTQ
jgi:hypothetical protein